MPQEPFGAFRINERRKRTNVRTPLGVQLDHMMPVINASLKRWRIPQILLRQIPVTWSVNPEDVPLVYSLPFQEPCRFSVLKGHSFPQSLERFLIP